MKIRSLIIAAAIAGCVTAAGVAVVNVASVDARDNVAACAVDEDSVIEVARASSGVSNSAPRNNTGGSISNVTSSISSLFG